MRVALLVACLLVVVPAWAVDVDATCTEAGVLSAVSTVNSGGGGTITFNCTDTTILFSDGVLFEEITADNFVMDGEDNNITLQYDGPFKICDGSVVECVDDGDCVGIGGETCFDCRQGDGWAGHSSDGGLGRLGLVNGDDFILRNLTVKYWMESLQLIDGTGSLIEYNTFDGHFCSDDALSTPGTTAANSTIQHNKFFAFWDKAIQVDRGVNLIDGNVFEDTRQPIRINNVTNETPGTYTITNNIMRWTDDRTPLFGDAISNCDGPYFTEVAHITMENNLVNCLRGVRIGSSTPLCVGGSTPGAECSDVTGDSDCPGGGDCEFTSEVEVNMLGNTVVGRIDDLVPYEGVGWENRFGVSMYGSVIVSMSDNWIQYGGENAGSGNAGGVILNTANGASPNSADLGGGSLSMLGTTVVSTGGNIIKNNAEDATVDNRDVRNLLQGYTMKAEENCWRGTTLGEVADDVDDVNDVGTNGTVDFDPLATDSCTGALLDVTVVSPTGGTVTGTGINCPGDCANTGSDVPYVLTATPTGDNTIGEWSGYGCNACQTGDVTCYVWIDSTNCAVEFVGEAEPDPTPAPSQAGRGGRVKRSSLRNAEDNVVPAGF